ncbi:MAG: Fic family protein [Thermoanaerobaculia bacterium]
MNRTTGEYERITAGGEEVAAFIPYPLPPENPQLALDTETRTFVHDAEHELARLELASEMVPSLDWFLYGFVRKEAVVSSQIEGTQATLVDLLTMEAGGFTDSGPAESDLEEICNYLEAVAYARKQIGREDGLPISMRLLNEAHRRLVKGVRGADRRPGEIRKSPNWVGGTRPGNAIFVPPPPAALPEVLSGFEKYIHSADELPSIVRVGMAHVQFETIHPYLDGNGRIGRLLITLLLEHWGLLAQPLLYLSLYFKRHQQEYYDRLGAVRSEGDWEGWTRFFLEGVITIAGEAVTAARELHSLVAADRGRVVAAPSGTLMAARLFEQLPEHPVVTIAGARKLLETTKPTAAKAIKALVDSGVLTEATGRKRDRTFRYTAYLDILRAGTELEAG